MKKMLCMVYLCFLCFGGHGPALSAEQSLRNSAGHFPNYSSSLSAAQALALLQKNNAAYVKAVQNPADISSKPRLLTAKHGQKPYALILSCADSRVPAEHIFLAGIGELFVVRNAGNVLSEAVLASMEYGLEHLGIKLIVVMGHSQCGAVGAALALDSTPNTSSDKLPDKSLDTTSSHQHSSALHAVLQGIEQGLEGEKDPRLAEKKHVRVLCESLQQQKPLQEMLRRHEVQVQGALYDVATGKVNFLQP